MDIDIQIFEHTLLALVVVVVVDDGVVRRNGERLLSDLDNFSN